ncbi:MAG TPA: substrate-binding domain-containing protein [Streptosporangiaceae bacterium]
MSGGSVGGAGSGGAVPGGPASGGAGSGSAGSGGSGSGGPGSGGPGPAGGGSPGGSGTGLRLARQARGFSQQQLAGMAGISRQAVSAVESGVSDPSLRVALALAHALGMTVEELFGPGSPAPLTAASPVAPLAPAGGRVALAPVGERLVALPLTGATATRAGFLPAGGRAAPEDPGPGRPGISLVRPIGPPRPTLLVAGCDPALPLIEAPLALLDPPVAFAWWPCGSSEALRLAADGLVHVAGAHLRDADGDYNTGPAGELLRGGAEVIRFCSWREGLVLRPGQAGQAGQVTGVADLPGSGLRLVNRDPGSEARRVLDRELAGHAVDPAALPGYDTRATGHLEVAAAIAAGIADVGVASEPAALAYGLAFLPLTQERFDLVIPAALAGSREVQAMLRVLSSPWLRDQLASLPGYDPSRCGEHLASLRGPGDRPSRSRIQRYYPESAE